MISISKAGISSVPVIRELALATWPLTYKEVISTEQIDYMLHLIYDESALQKQIEKGHQFILAIENDVAVGFASYSPRKENAAVYKLYKLYVLPEHQGKSIGNILLNYTISDIQKQHITILELNVNRNNIKALHFYQKNGFEIIYEEDIDIGNGYFMNDYVMQKKI